MKYNQPKPNRRAGMPQRKSIRLKGYDYKQAGLYFITICVQHRECLFGEIVDGKMILNDAGKMVHKWYYELENKFPDIRCHEMITMPNHFHCIIENAGTVGADLRVRPYNGQLNVQLDNKQLDKIQLDNKQLDKIQLDNKQLDKIQLDNKQSNKIQLDNGQTDNGQTDNGQTDDGQTDDGQTRRSAPTAPTGELTLLGVHTGSPLHRVVQWFKTMTTNEYIRGVKTLGWIPFDGKLWQRNYWEHIIRNENSYHRIAQYILNNPEKWNNDTLK